MMNKKMVNGGTVVNWICINFSRNVQESVTHGSCSELLQSLSKELDLLVFILPDNNGSLYGDLKRICETEIGVVSQCTRAWSHLGL
uniref:Uncharacterized protein n=1 Tax=Solanum lycopersicum TaxID=4081 RepID=K4BHT7_SOLLC